jgi:phospholipid/cholesterol/gamma-HCH transport system permease protein
MQNTPPRVSRQTLPQGECAQLAGLWTAAELAQPAVWAALQRELPAVRAAQLGWDLRQIERLDHTGAQLLWNSWGRQWPTQLQALPAQRTMLERVARYTVAPPAPVRPTLRDA